MTDYVWRIHLMVPASQAALAAEAASQALPGGEAERAMFGVPLQRTRVPFARESMLGCSTLMTERQRADLMDSLSRRGVDAVWVRLGANDERAAEASEGLTAPTGLTWDWEDTLAATECQPATEVTDGG